MTFEEFQRAVVAGSALAPEVAPALQALWHDARGDWAEAHRWAQDDLSRAGSWVHAYLHRKEGDLANAEYWYARARRMAPARSVALDVEWAEIARELLG